MKLGNPLSTSQTTADTARSRTTLPVLQQKPAEEGLRPQVSGVAYQTQSYLPSRSAHQTQRAVDFYNMTAEISNFAGEGELIGVDTYA